MIPDFIHTYHCGEPGKGSCAHCLTCLVNADWRKQVGAPDICPWGVTAENYEAKKAENLKALGQRNTEAAKAASVAVPSLRLPGDLLAYVIHEVTGEKVCGGCDQRRQQMNEWGWLGCLQNVATIYGWLQAECEKRKLTVKKLDVLEALVKAIKAGLVAEKLKTVDKS